jgi:DNA sulfur modification protein DndC
LYEIRRIWRTERGDWEDSIPKIYREITGQDLNWSQDDLAFSSKEKSLLLEICEKHTVPIQLVMKLFDAELQTQGMSRRSSIYNRIDRVLSEEWRSEEEVMISRASDSKNSNDGKVIQV